MYLSKMDLLNCDSDVTHLKFYPLSSSLGIIIVSRNLSCGRLLADDGCRAAGGGLWAGGRRTIGGRAADSGRAGERWSSQPPQLTPRDGGKPPRSRDERPSPSPADRRTFTMPAAVCDLPVTQHSRLPGHRDRPIDRPEPTDRSLPTDRSRPTPTGADRHRPEPTDRPTGADRPTDRSRPTGADRPEPTDRSTDRSTGADRTDRQEPTDRPTGAYRPEPTNRSRPTGAYRPTDRPTGDDWSDSGLGRDPTITDRHTGSREIVANRLHK